MCGISGIVHKDRQAPVNKEVLKGMCQILTHRGPDDVGYYISEGVGLGSRRLSIIDLSKRGHMPMSTSDGRFWIVYNGEVYNYQELRHVMESRGYSFRSNTDTEVVLSLFAAEGPAMLERLNGMFAMAIWDSHKRELFLARDRLGIKPLYYTDQPKTFSFASEEKALFAKESILPEFNHETWEELLCFRYITGEKTPYVGIKRLLPGHFLLYKDGNFQIRRWWKLADKAAVRSETPSTRLAEEYLENFEDAVRLRLISDVPLGVFLSGGLDSSSLAATLAQQIGAGVSSFNMRFDEPEFDEGPLAELVARRYSFTNHQLKVSSEDLLELLKKASWLNDEPLAHGNDAHLYAIARYAKPLVTVLLSGEGADETLGGYVRYRLLRFPRILNLSFRLLPNRMLGLIPHPRIRKLANFMTLGCLEKFIIYNSCNTLPFQLAAIGFQSKAEFPYREKVLEEAQSYSREPIRQLMYLDQHTFLCSLLDRNDRMTMGASIECRVPFLDYRLVEIAAALPTSTLFGEGQGKWILRRNMRTRLPPEILHHRKWGFGVPWIRFLREDKDLRQFLMELDNKEPISSGPFDRSAIRNIIDRFLAGSNDSYLLLLQLLMIVIWYEITIVDQPHIRAEEVPLVC